MNNKEFDIIDGKKYKKCNDNQIRNILTKRCVLKDGKIGKILKLDKKEISIKKNDDINNDICIKWLMNKTKNPITGRTITEKGAIYKKYLKNCNILNEKAIKIQNFFLKKFKRLVKKEKETPVKKETQVKKETPVKKASPVKKEKKQEKGSKKEFINKNSCIEKINDELIIDNKIKLIKHFGTPSTFGINYICSFINDDKFKFSGKIQINSGMAKTELVILEELYKIRLETNNLHIPIIYGNVSCPVSKINNREDLPGFLKNPKKVGYLIIFNELLCGDLKNYLYNIALDNYDLWLNAIEQIYMCLASLHSVGFIHNDSHYGNFLYKKINPGGYFHYNINGKDYYIPNLGYIWVIWDFGVCGPIFRYYDYIRDYNFLNLFLRYDNPAMITKSFKIKFPLDGPNNPHRNYGYIDKSKLVIPKKIESLVEKLWAYTGVDNELFVIELEKTKQSEDIWFEFLVKNKLLFNHNITDEELLNSTTINFQTVGNSKSLLLNTKLFKIDAIGISKKFIKK
jgi:hypothetical protein